ncbi:MULTISPECIES: DUF4160 domain-containing protein [unclassified Fibrobacter]|jgi:hypothetical protein|uniref:DUF4160 domain-containing protein n=1 Tax=unclassified Fibrobacter TaxID=2634177 RepID=UPI0009109422|nr:MULTISPECIES: DUF4160 domain-containing protein [unclassified Fibrobacter]SHM93483.1 protein of unknown function [Fibrobacter sp. UWB7]SMG34638.1 protein of unknown function [Fibrobacter sp. UWB13]
MPKIFEAEGFSFFFYMNEHEPVHVHVRKQGKIAKFEILNGYAVPVFGKLSKADMAKASELATENSELIIKKWFEIFG